MGLLEAQNYGPSQTIHAKRLQDQRTHHNIFLVSTTMEVPLYFNSISVNISWNKVRRLSTLKLSCTSINPCPMSIQGNAMILNQQKMHIQAMLHGEWVVHVIIYNKGPISCGVGPLKWEWKTNSVRCWPSLPILVLVNGFSNTPQRFLLPMTAQFPQV